MCAGHRDTQMWRPLVESLWRRSQRYSRNGPDCCRVEEKKKRRTNNNNNFPAKHSARALEDFFSSHVFLFFNLWLITMMKIWTKSKFILPKQAQNFAGHKKILKQFQINVNILSKWQDLARSSHTGYVLSRKITVNSFDLTGF